MATVNIPKELEPKVEALKAALEAATTPRERMEGALRLGEVLRAVAPLEAAPYFLLARDLSRELADPTHEATAENRRSAVAWNTGNLEESAALARRALELANRVPDQTEAATALSQLGIIALERADYEQAREFYEQARDMSRASGHTKGLQSSLNGLGNVAMVRGETDEALGYYGECLKLNEEIGDDHGRAGLHTNIGLLLEQAGRWEDAAENLYRAMAICEQHGYHDIRHYALNNLGEMFLKRDRLDRAIGMFSLVAEAGRRQVTSPLVLRDALSNLGQAYWRRGDSARAVRAYNTALTLCRESDDRRGQAIIAGRLAEVSLARGARQQAAEQIEEALGLARAAQLRPETAEALRVQALLSVARGDDSAAVDAFEAALAELAGVEESFELARLRLQYGRFLVSHGDQFTGSDNIRAAAKVFRRLHTVAETLEANRLLFHIESEREPDMALLQAGSALSSLGLTPDEQVERMLDLLCEGFRFDRGALFIDGHAVVHRGHPDVHAGRELMRTREIAASPTGLAFPVRSRGRVLGSIYLERDQPGSMTHNTVILETMSSLLAVTVQRLADIRSRLSDAGAPVAGLELDGYVGTDARTRDALVQAAAAALLDTPVLLVGETGTGRETLARALHDSGPRSPRPFLVACGTGIPAEEFEAELFGAAAAGPDPAETGKVEEAGRGTIYVADVDTLSPRLQEKLLGLIERGSFRRADDGPETRTEVRVLAGTSQDLAARASDGQFSAALYQRLSASVLALPPLRERRDDLPAMVRYFIERCNQEFSRRVDGASPALLDRLVGYSWPGNLDELQQVIERSVLLARTSTLDVSDIPERTLDRAEPA